MPANANDVSERSTEELRKIPLSEFMSVPIECFPFHGAMTRWKLFEAELRVFVSKSARNFFNLICDISRVKRRSDGRESEERKFCSARLLRLHATRLK